MIVGFFGNVRQGKTLGAVAELYKYYLNGFTIYSNTHLNFPYKPLTLDYILDIVEHDLDVEDNSVFFIDEIYIWQDSRVSGGKRNRIISYFLLQTGKLGVNKDFGLILMFTAQFPDQIDKRLRHVLDIAVECEKIVKGDRKVFIQCRHIFRGSKSYNYKLIMKNPEDYFSLYDTRKKIVAVMHDRYDEVVD
jgi:hypothetical protein